MRSNVAELRSRVDDGRDVVLAEPSDAVMFQSDALDLLSGANCESAAASTYGVCEYLDTFRLDENVDWDASGTSCRTQLGDRHLKPIPAGSSLVGTNLDGEEPPTPLELLPTHSRGSSSAATEVPIGARPSR